MITLSSEQSLAAETVLSWCKRTIEDFALGREIVKPYFTFGGLAGTGKTTVLSHLTPLLRAHCRFVMCAPTGKAVSVLRSKGIPAATIHSLFYTPERDAKNKIVFRKKEPHELYQEVDMIAIDEASMVSQEVHDDLLSYKVPILYVGDYGQLPPVGKDPQILSRCDAKLETIHRQALNSPIIRLAHHVRTSGAWEDWPEWKTGGVGDGSEANQRLVRRLSLKDPAVFDHGSQFIVGSNSERVALNKHIRQAWQRTTILHQGDRVTCLKNDRRVGVFNGMTFTVQHCCKQDGNRVTATLESDDGLIYPDLDLYTGCFNVEKPSLMDGGLPWGLLAFDYAYALTAHKAQGSSFLAVSILETKSPLWTRNRWLYTAITRAESRLTILTK